MKEEKVVEEQATKKDVQKLNIFQKMSMATARIQKVAKKLKVGEGTKQSYNAVSEADVLEAVKPIEIELGIYSYPFDRKIVTESRDTFKNSFGEKENYIIRLETIYRFVNTDNPSEFIDIKTYGDGVDSQDKAPGKAMTYADKYALLKAYKIGTGDDPDKNLSGKLTRNKAEDELKLIYINKMNMLLSETETDIEEMLRYFGAKDIESMSLNDTKKAVVILEKKKSNLKGDVF